MGKEKSLAQAKMSNDKVYHVDSTPNAMFLNTLRNSGYNNYTAIADIIDNSIDTDVDSTKVSITFEGDSINKSFKFIKITDNGSGMDLDTLRESLKLGAVTGKSREKDLGSYGTGLKAAGLSIGRRIVIKTKSKDDELWIATYDLDEILENGWNSPTITQGKNSEYDEFKEQTGSETGTIIVLDKLDRISDYHVTQFKNKLIKDISLFYKVFIDELGVQITVNNEIVKSFDPMFRNESFSTRMSSLNEKFNYKNKEIKFNAFYLEKMDDRKNLGINQRNAGLYIYRNNRLVGSGLDLGIIGKLGDGYANGIRIELLIDGDCDEIFGSTYIKMIHEKDKGEIEQGFKDSCQKALLPFVKYGRAIERSGKSNSKIKDEDKKEWDNIGDRINKNKLIKVKKSGKNTKKDTPDNKKPTMNPGRNKFSNRKRDDAFADFKFVNLGEAGNLFNVSKENGKHVVHMNVDHLFWTEFLHDATNETKGIIARLFVSMTLSLDSIGYYDDAEKEVLLGEYLLEMSSNLRKLIKG
jgi:hypothetical protein